MDARGLIDELNLRPHPEGGWYAETWRGDESPRASGSAIYFLLEAHQSSRWHAVDAVEIWHWYAGGALDLHVHHEGAHEGATRVQRLGVDFERGQRPQGIVPRHAWQRAAPVDGWTLVGCTVSPGFEFAGFRLAEPDWSPGPG